MSKVSLILLGIMVMAVPAAPALCLTAQNDVTVFGSYMVAQAMEPGDTETSEQPDATMDAGEPTQPVQPEPAEPPADSTDPTVVPPADTDTPAAPGATEPVTPAQPETEPAEPAAPETTPEPEPATEPMQEEAEPTGAGPAAGSMQEPAGAGPEAQEYYYAEDRETLPMAGANSGLLYVCGSALVAVGIVMRRRSARR